ncbi:MAG: sterol desaturase family protein [Porticoccaceae bacterium]|nr:sterol desaturase family protein [Porticoccaceae bacterium]
MTTINDALPPWAVWLATAVAIDFTFYWYHRSSHRVRFLWAVHMNHHSSTEMNFSVAFRQAWFGPITKTPFFMVLPLTGFDPSITVVCAVALRLYGVFGHTQWIDKLGWLDIILSTPSNHRVHHGSNSEYIDKNYGNFLIIWDRLFGTFAREKTPVTFGLVNNLGTNNPIKITFHLWAVMARNLSHTRSFREAVGYVIGPPEWSDKDV